MPRFRLVTPILLFLLLFLMGQISIQDAQIGDFVFLNEKSLQSRSTGNFSRTENNRDITLPKGTWGEIKKKKLFNSGNYGLQISTTYGDETKDVWVYYRKNAPHNGILLYNQEQASELRGVASPSEERTTDVERADYIYVNKKGVKAFTLGGGATNIGNLLADSSYKIDTERYQRYAQSLPEGVVGNWVPLTLKSEGNTVWVRLQDIMLSEQITGSLETTLLPTDQVCEVDPIPVATPAPIPRQKVSNLSYQACNASNNYLEPKLALALEASRKQVKSFPFDRSYTDTIKRCVQESIGMGQEGSYIRGADCPNDQTFLKDTEDKQFPCASQKAVDTLAYELAMAAECADVDPRELIALYHHESRFRIDARSPTDAMGPAQITKGAVLDLEQMFDGAAYPRFLRHLDRKGSKCEYIEKMGAIPSSKRQFNCARSSLPENPRRNIIYGAFYYKRIRDWGPKSASAWVDKFIAAGRIIPSERQLWTEEIVRAMYNGGPGQISSIAEAVLDGSTTLTGGSFRQAKESWRKVIKTVNAEAGRYAEKVMLEGAILNAKQGVTCAI